MEKYKSIEQIEDQSIEVVLEFMRHGEKESDPNKKNQDLLLTQKGREMAFEKGQQLDLDASNAIAFGSPKDRTKETAGHVMLANEDIDPNASLEEMRREISRFQKVGKKIIEDKRLDFDTSGPAGVELSAAFKIGKYIEVLISDSDRLAIERNDKVTTTYIRQAGSIAEIVAKYSKIAENFYRIKSDKENIELTNKLERYLATHQGVCEAFIAKCLEKIKGNSARDEFVKSIGAGFKELEGMDVKIKKSVNNKSIIISYPFGNERRTLQIEDDQLQDILDERKEFERNFK